MGLDKNLLICKKCKALCCKMGGTDFTEKEMVKIKKAGNSIKFRKVGKNHYEFKTDKNGACLYLKNNACTIYKERPNSCKSWPVEYPYIEKNKKRFTLVLCPLTSNLSKKEIQNLKEIASKIPIGLGEESIKGKNLPNEDMVPCIRRLPKKTRDLCIKRYNKFKTIELI